MNLNAQIDVEFTHLDHWDEEIIQLLCFIACFEIHHCRLKMRPGEEACRLSSNSNLNKKLLSPNGQRGYSELRVGLVEACTGRVYYLAAGGSWELEGLTSCSYQGGAARAVYTLCVSRGHKPAPCVKCPGHLSLFLRKVLPFCVVLVRSGTCIQITVILSR